MVTFFFQFLSSPIVWFLAIKQNLSEPRLNLLFLLSRSRRILKGGPVKRLLPTVPKWTNNEQESRPIYRTAIFWLSTKCRPTIDRVELTNYWPIHRSSIDKLSAKCRWSIAERKAMSAEIHVERLSSDYRPFLDRVSTDYRRISTAISTEWRPTISTDRSVDTTLSKHDPNNIALILNILNRKVL